jgi:hypothetical protein
MEIKYDVDCVEAKRCGRLFVDVQQFSADVMSTSFTAMKGAVNIRMPDRYCLVSMATRCVHVRCRCAATLGRVSSLHISITL